MSHQRWVQLLPPEHCRVARSGAGLYSNSTLSREPNQREFTARGLMLGVLLAVILGAANAYLGLYAGMTVSASIPAAVISMAILRLLGNTSILENNVVQTTASAGEAVAAGAIFTFPALVVLGKSEILSYWTVTLLCAAGATIGSMLIIMLRRPYIIEERLPYPEGVACAQVLRAGQSGATAVRPLLAGSLISAGVKAGMQIGGVVPGAIQKSFWAGRMPFSASCDISAALLGVGYIIGLPIASIVLGGGIIAWMICVPILGLSQPEFHRFPAEVAAASIWRSQVRFMGVGAMLTGGLATLWRMRGPILKAVGEVRHARLGLGRSETSSQDLDISITTVVVAIAVCIPIIALLYARIGHSAELGILLALALTVIGFFAASVAGYLTGVVGASNNPVSGVTLIILLAVALILKCLGVSAVTGPAVAILAGAVVAVAAAMAGDSLHDLATGYHLGATPRALEIAVLVGALVSAMVVAPVLNLLIKAYGIAGTPGATSSALSAPQAFLMAQVVTGVFSRRLPWGMIGIGAALALILHLTDTSLMRRGSRWRTPPMPLAIGLYLPLGLSVTIAIGALLRPAPTHEVREEASSGVLFAAGMIAGEALMGIVVAALVTAGIKLPLW